MGYLRGTLNYLKIIGLLDPTQMMNMVDLAAIGVKTPRIYNECSFFKKKLIELIPMNP